MGYHLDLGLVLSGVYLSFFLTGILWTLRLFAVAWILAFALALLLTVARATGVRAAEAFVAGYVEYHRNVPLLVQLFVWYFGISQVFPDSFNSYINDHNAEFIFAVIALALCSAAYMSEDFRSGLRAIPTAQTEAARGMGFPHVAAMRWVIIPQAWRMAMPALVNQTLVLFKATSLASAIGLSELTLESHRIEDQTFRVFESFGVATLLYLAGSFTIMFSGAALARRVKLRLK